MLLCNLCYLFSCNQIFLCIIYYCIIYSLLCYSHNHHTLSSNKQELREKIFEPRVKLKYIMKGSTYQHLLVSLPAEQLYFSSVQWRHRYSKASFLHRKRENCSLQSWPYRVLVCFSLPSGPELSFRLTFT